MNWDYLSYVLATRGVPSLIEEDAELPPGTELSPWVPRPTDALIRITISEKDAGFLAAILELKL